jgi:hypothetical protein
LSGTTASGATFDEAALVTFEEDATDGWDRHDASKLFPFSAPAALLAPSSERDGAPYRHAVRSLPYELARRSGHRVPLALYTTDDGAYTLSWALEGIPDRWQLRLRDGVTGEEVDLRAATSHAFASAATGDWADRFTLLLELVPGAADAAATLPGEYGLSAVYPNPARGAARFTLRVAEAQAVTVGVYDVLGRRVALLHDGALEAEEEHEFTVGGSDLADGTYVVRVDGETFSETRRLTLLR